MYLIFVQNVKEIKPQQGFSWLKITCKKEKCEENWVIFRNVYVSHKLLSRVFLNLACKVM